MFSNFWHLPLFKKKKKEKCTANSQLKYKQWMKSFTFWHFWADTKESVVDARDCRQWLIDPDFFAHFLANVLVFRWICHSNVGLFCLRRFCFRVRFFHQRFHCIIVCDEKRKPSENKQLIQRQIKIYSQRMFTSLHKSRKNIRLHIHKRF